MFLTSFFRIRPISHTALLNRLIVFCLHSSMHAARTPIGVFTFDETGTMVSWQRFDTAPETALKLFEHGVPDEDARAYAFVRPRQREYALQHFTNRAEFNTFMTRFGILFSKQRMKVAIGRDKLL